MAVTLMVVAVLGNVASISLYAAPTYVVFLHSITVSSSHFVIMKHWPTMILLVQGYLQKGHKEEKHRGVFMHSLHHSPDEQSPLHLVKVGMTAAAVLTVVGVIGIVSTFGIPDHRHRKLLVGSISLGVSIAMYASPLVAMLLVGQFIVDDLWTPHSRFFRCGAKCNRNSLGHPPAGSPLQILEEETDGRTEQAKRARPKAGHGNRT
ncbi:hypothetical protein VNO80_02781 [Phaseolus coccineus]|uniref:Uncharacterized protein n=1 Tax=Phaseolus coccineus TaxID=3886 RepID=A0AAN9RRK5_PHACN